ncbi:MAG: hypothetical protein CVV02_05580 [Firmicutes bacterium HGW-Firmicutes-7]|nr:MAG: hypothetical protein CVV02_05580 [Firmicutes bacterium HGW-Firmicutes-7]
MKGKRSNHDVFEMIKLGEITPEEGLLQYKKIENDYEQKIESDSLYFKYIWEKSELENDLNNKKYGKCILIFDLDEHIKEQALSETHGKIILVKPGVQYEHLSNAVFTIRKNIEEDYSRLLNELKDNNINPDTVIHMWSESFDHNQEKFRKQLEAGIYSVFYLVKALMKQKLERRINLHYYYSVNDKEPQPINQAVSAFLKTVAIENANLLCRTIQLDKYSNRSKVLLQETIIMEERPIEIKYENNNRFIKSLSLLDADSSLEASTNIKSHGVYLITGGCGGLGLIFATYLAKQKQVNLILTGRSELTSKSERSIQRLKELGANVTYIKSDIASKAQVADLIELIKSQYEKIDGVIHSAGVIRDAFVMKKSTKDMDEVFSPKVLGLINLAQALKNENVDFFAVFSSLSGVNGNIGQCDYAYANCFMDCYVQLMKEAYGKVISIAWPLWKDGGMEVDIETKERLLKDFGLQPMSIDHGIKAFEVGLRLPKEEKQLIVFEGNKDKILNLLSPLKPRKRQNKIAELETGEVEIKTIETEAIEIKAFENFEDRDKNEILKKTEAYFKQMLAKEIQMPANKIQADDTFENYGIDSVMIMNLNKLLEKDFNNLPKTLLFEYQNISELSNYFIKNHLNKLLEKLDINHKPHITKSVEEPVANKVKPRFIEAPAQTTHYSRKNHEEEDIAIIGVSGRYPMAETLDEFWSNLKAGKDCITEIPPDRWDYKEYFDPDKNKKGTSYSKWGGFIKDVDKFDPLFFNISPKEAELMDPQERLFLETAWHTLEDGGYTRRSLSEKRVGVFVGVMYGYYQFYGAEESIKGHNIALNSSYATIANRVSYLLNLNGPSMAVDTMCSSSLTSIHLACDSIRLGQSEMALAGGVNLTIHPNKYILLSQGKFAASDGKCRSFGEGGDGYVPGEGIGAVLLKSLKKAEEDGDRIYAIIKASTLNHGGRTNGYSVPNPNAQGELIDETIRKSKIDPRTISYVEAHGTGTSLGDPIEISGLVKAFSEHTKDKQFCSIGSAKSVIGHLESAAGVAAVTKVILQMKYEQLVPSIHSKVLNPNINFKETPFYVQHDLEEWLCPKINGTSYPRRAGISSFGAGGSNAHIILEEYKKEETVKRTISEPYIFTLSAKNKEQLNKYVETIAKYLEQEMVLKREEESNLEKNISIVKDKIIRDLIENVSTILNVNRKEIDVSENITEYGFDPLNISKLVNKINESYNLGMTSSIITEYSSIEVLATYLITKFKKNMMNYYATLQEQEKKVTSEKINLEELVYTLQTGREGMEERLAIVVSSLEELKEKLENYRSNKKNIENLFNRNIRENKENIIFDGDLGKEFARKIIEERDMLKLAQLWASGLEIEWKQLYNGRKLKPICLPQYPFARERYWIPSSEFDETIFNRGDNNDKKLHPLIGKNISDLEEQKYTTTFTGKEFYLCDHQISGHNILPGVAYIEMARAAGQMAGKRKIKKIKNIVWVRPLTIGETTKETCITLYPKENDVAYEVISQEAAEPFTNGYGVLEYANDEEEIEEYIDIDVIQKRCIRKLNQEEIYKLFDENHINYGDSFQSVIEINCNEVEVLGKIELPQILKGSFQDFILHPSMMDGALQAIIGVLEKEMALGVPYLPFSLKEVDILCPLTKKCFIHVRKADMTQNSAIKNFDLNLTDEAGKILIKMKGLVLRAMSATITQKALKKTAILKYSSQWEKEKPSKKKLEEKIDSIVLFDVDHALCNTLKKTIRQVILIRPGKKYAELDKDLYEIRTNNEEDYERLLMDLKNKNINLRLIIHNWSKDKYDSNEKAVKLQLNKGVYSLFNLTTEIMKGKVKDKIKILYRYTYDDEAAEPSYAGVSAFAKTVKIENPQIEIKTVGMLAAQDEGRVEDLLFELQEQINLKNIDIRYDETDRYIRSIRKITEQDLNYHSSKLKENGVYIISGGTGGLGLIFAQHIAKKAKANIVLTGRSELNAFKKEKIKVLEALGSQVEYMVGDVSIRDDVQNMIKKTKERFGNINGIIHSAGITHDSLLLRKTSKEMKEVIDPKVYGIIWLDEATKEEPLDFFAVFSSTSSILGNVGQSDYAYANSFMDHYCERRESFRQQGKRTGKTLSINWPLWKEGGMTMDEASKKWMEERLGLVPLNTDDGVKAFEQGLNSSQVGLIVFAGDEEKIDAMLGFKGYEKLEVEETVLEISENKIDELKEKTEKYLKNMLSKETKIPLNKIDARKVFDEYGIDSVMIVNMNRELEACFGELTKTLLFEYQNISDLAMYFIENHRSKLIEKLDLGTHPLSKAIKAEATIEEQVSFISKSRFQKVVSEGLQQKDDIAIIGLSGRYPMANNVKEFWDNLTEGRDCVTEIPEDRWDFREYFDTNKDVQGKSYSKWGGFMSDVDKFDPLFFNISPKEAELMDPQERLFLETAWNTVEDAGYTRAELSKRKVGVYVGVMYGHYQLYGAEESLMGNGMALSSSYASIANRVSYCLNLSGTSLAVDTMCSSSLTSVHLACESIHRGENQLAIAGGVNVSIHPNKYIALSQGRFASSDGKCRSFGEGGDGYVPGEGVGAILLKSLKQAKEDHDHIYAIIKGSSVNHGGKTNGYTVPNPNAQKEVICEAIKKAEIDPRTISYIEAHGTGTSLGDPIEITGLVKAFDEYTKDKQYCSIGSAKANIGHLESAAGIAGITKVLLQMKYKQLVPSIHSDLLNSNINFKETPFWVQHQLEEWKCPEVATIKYPRRAGISSFGAGGSNAHIILEEADDSQYKEESVNDKPQLILLSAKNVDRLKAYVKELLTTFEKHHNSVVIEEGSSKTEIEEVLITFLSQVIGVKKEEIKLTEAFEDYGLEPIHLLKLASSIEEKYNIEIKREQFVAQTSLKDIVEVILTNKKEIVIFEQSEAVDLTEMAYTLQVGREAMTERIALIVSNTEDLTVKLSQYLVGKMNIDGLYFGNAVSEKVNTILTEGRAAEEFIKTMIRDKELDKLAQLWVSGVEIDWRKLYEGHGLSRLSLPTYPFAKERYWIPERKKARNNGNKRPHPLIESNTSNLREQKYTTTFTGEEFYFTDHIISNQKMLPGAAYIEMAHAAGEIAGEEKVCKIKNIMWTQPIVIKDEPEIVSIHLYPHGDLVAYEVTTEAEDNSRRLHSQGELEFAMKENCKTKLDIINIDEIKKSCDYISREACYELFMEKGFAYGDGFKTIQEIFTGATETLVHLKLPEKLKNDFNQYVLHPSIIDGALQAVIGITKTSTEDVEASYVPFSIEEIVLLNTLSEECYVHAVLLDAPVNHGVRKYDIYILDMAGVILVKINNLMLRAFAPIAINRNNTIYFSDHWEMASKDFSNNSKKVGTTLVLSNDLQSNKNINSLEGKIIVVMPGKAFKQLSDTTYEINPQSKAHYRQLATKLKEDECIPDSIIHMWNIEDFNNGENIQQQLEKGAYCVMYLCQALAEQKPRKTIRLVYCYESYEQDSQPQNAALSGLLRTITIENPNMKCKCVEVVLPSDFDLLSRAVEEMEIYDGIEVLYKNNVRYVKQFEKLEVTNENNNTINIQNKGVYIITGGTGGLGIITARFLAKEFNARLILSGRSALNDEKEKELEKLRELGAEVIYISADVSKREEVEKLILTAKTHFKTINGVIHSAGVVRDSFLIKKTREEMEAVLAPKVYGTIYLDHATKNEKLDFFIVYSSVAGKLGNVGQGDYAFGNGFIDHYCKKRDKLKAINKRSGITLSINWPLWKDGGMKVNKAIEKNMEEQMGLVPLGLESGIKALQDGLKLGVVNMLVLSGDEARISRMVEAQKNTNKIEKTSKPDLSIHQREQLYHKSEAFFKELLSKEIKLPATRIISSEPFEKYGIDSVMIISLNKEFEKYFGELPKTLLFEYQNLEELTNYFMNTYNEKLIEITGMIKEKAPIKSQEVHIGQKEGINNRPRFYTSAIVGNETINKDIAIIGLSGRYPMAKNIEAFWENIQAGKDCITEIPSDRWDHSKYYDPDKKKKGKCYSKWGGFLEDIDKFDPLFFNISPKEAEIMDPQERLFLETAWHAVEDAGYTKDALNQSCVGVFVGVMNGHYQMYGAEESMKGNVMALSSSYASIANRVSYCLNLSGPSIALDTMCSSSITAVHLACESIRSGDSDIVIAGGVNLSIHPNKYIGLSQGKFVSSDGKCRSFGEGGDGYVPGEGVGAIILKPLHKALEDKDQVYGVIKGSSLNHGGKTNGYTIPNPNAQGTLIDKAIKRSGIDPRTISYIEAHGTGTSLGDPVEISGLIKSLGKYSSDKQYCSIGSVKSNIGHLESAAGIAGITKVLLQMKHKKLVPSLHSQVLNPNINFMVTPFHVQNKLEDWKQPEIGGRKAPRRAGISAFGAGGANAHIIIEEYVENAYKEIMEEQKPHIVLLSASNSDRLREYAFNLIKTLERALNNKATALSIDNISYTLQVSREAMDERVAVIAYSIPEAIQQLKQYLSGEGSNDKIYIGNKRSRQLTLDKLIKAQKGKEFINELFQNNEFELLAELWVCGINLDWRVMYENNLLQKISLPLYPFAKERYWVPTTIEKIYQSTTEITSLSDMDATKRLEISNVVEETSMKESAATGNSIREDKEVDHYSSIKEVLEERTRIYFMELMCEEIKLPIERIEVDVPIEKYGIDSVMIMQFTNELEKIFGQLPKTLFFEYHTIAELTNYFLELYQDQLIELFGLEEKILSTKAYIVNEERKKVEPETVAELLLDIEDLSEEEVTRLLDQIKEGV